MIRRVRTADQPAVATMVEAAFGQPDEARLVERLRLEGDVLFELLAENDGRVDGHILFSRLWADSEKLYAALAPLAVHPSRQRTGVGAALVRSSLEQAREFGAHGVIVLGHPGYYARFGFSADATTNIRSVYAGVPAFMALAIERGAFDAPLNVTYPNAFSA